MTSTNRIIFLEDREQVDWVSQSITLKPTTKLIAITAEALQALEEYDLPHEAISVYADARQLANTEEQFTIDCYSLAQEIESFIASQTAAFRFEGPGFLSGQGYHIQYAISAIVTRAFLMREAIRMCVPKIVTVFDDGVEPWFRGSDYERSPWLDVIENMAAMYGFQLEVLSRPIFQSVSQSILAPRLHDVFYFLRRSYGFARRQIYKAQFVTPQLTLSGLAGLRLLMADLAYDWVPIQKTLSFIPDTNCFTINSVSINDQYWASYYTPSIRNLSNNVTYKLNSDLPKVDESEIQQLKNLFDEWARRRYTPPLINVLGMNLFPALFNYLRTLTSIGPTIVRHTNCFADEAFAVANPQAVCFFAMPWLANKRLAFHCRQRQIPVVCFQHGGVYGTHISAKSEMIELAHADYFFTHGDGIQPREKPAFPPLAKYISIGSVRLAMLPKDNESSSYLSLGDLRLIKVLWIAEYSTRNTLGSTFQVEDTERYLSEKVCLELLNSAHALSLTYRPYMGSEKRDGTTRWISRKGLRRIKVDAFTPIDELIRRSDVVITNTSSNTVWNEVLVRRKPLILYCDPAQTLLRPRFSADIEQAVFWCKTYQELITALRQLADRDKTFLFNLQQINPTTFIQRYVLHLNNGRSVERAVSFLNDVCRNHQSLEDWERHQLDHPKSTDR